nr:hypothetical protein [Tanacetum cinerariifolium]
MDTCTTLSRRVKNLELDKIAQALEIKKLKRRVKKLESENKERMIADMDADADVVLEEAKEVVDDAKDVLVATLTVAPTRVTAAPSRRRKGVVIRDPQAYSTTSTTIPAKTRSNDKGKGILVEKPKPLKKQAQIKQDEKYASELEAELNRNIDWDKAIDYVNKKAKEDPAVKRYQALKRKPQTEGQARKNMIIYLKNTQEQIKEEESRAIKRLNETPAKKVAKRQKLHEDVEELKRHLQIVPNEDDDVYTKAILLARKVPIVGYEIINQNNKPYYKIIRADEMFKKPDIHAQIWKNQRSVYGPAKDKGWKLLESCGV